MVFALLLMLVGWIVTTVQAVGGVTVDVYQVRFQLWRGTDLEGWTKKAVTTQPDDTLTFNYASNTPLS